MNLSVVVPTYNRCSSLRRTLDGLALQTVPLDTFEVIVVSDGSTDGTHLMLAEYSVSARYPVRVIVQPNRGPSAARNRGIQEARHDIIVMLDDDVEPMPAFLERHASHHDADERVAVLGPMSPDPSARASEPAWIAWEHAKLAETYALFQPGGAYAGHDAGPMHFYSGNASVRRCWLEQAGGFDEAYTRQEDVELGVRLAERCGVRFVFDFAADGLHRPSRSFESWLRVPKAYGHLDACRVRDGRLDAREIGKLMSQRNAGSRALASCCTRVPALLPVVQATARFASARAYHSGRTGPAVSILSGLYNACYAEAYEQESRRSRRAETLCPEAAS